VRDQDERTLDDAALIERVASGDRRAFTVLVERHGAALYRFLVPLVGDAAVAEDALQDAFAAVWRHAGTFRGASSGRTWLYTIARHAVTHRLRRHENRPGFAESLESLEDLGDAAGWGDPSSGDRVMAALEDRDRVQKALATLSPEDRELLALVDVEELSVKEAAEAVGVGVAALKSRLHRARLRLLAQLGKEVSHEG
jgi:RNA polymerase sigma-70 factor (ECF subfamily)